MSNEVFADEAVVASARWKDRAISRDGFLKVASALSNRSASAGCLPLDTLVNFSELSESFELSDGRFLGFDFDERRGLASSRLCTADFVGDGGVK